MLYVRDGESWFTSIRFEVRSDLSYRYLPARHHTLNVEQKQAHFDTIPVP